MVEKSGLISKESVRYQVLGTHRWYSDRKSMSNLKRVHSSGLQIKLMESPTIHTKSALALIFFWRIFSWWKILIVFCIKVWRIKGYARYTQLKFIVYSSRLNLRGGPNEKKRCESEETLRLGEAKPFSSEYPDFLGLLLWFETYIFIGF